MSKYTNLERDEYGKMNPRKVLQEYEVGHLQYDAFSNPNEAVASEFWDNRHGSYSSPVIKRSEMGPIQRTALNVEGHPGKYYDVDETGNKAIGYDANLEQMQNSARPFSRDLDSMEGRSFEVEELKNYNEAKKNTERYRARLDELNRIPDNHRNLPSDYYADEFSDSGDYPKYGHGPEQTVEDLRKQTIKSLDHQEDIKKQNDGGKALYDVGRARAATKHSDLTSNIPKQRGAYFRDFLRSKTPRLPVVGPLMLGGAYMTAANESQAADGSPNYSFDNPAVTNLAAEELYGLGGGLAAAALGTGAVGTLGVGAAAATIPSMAKAQQEYLRDIAPPERRMDKISRQNPNTNGTPEAFLRAMEGPVTEEREMPFYEYYRKAPNTFGMITGKPSYREL